MRLFLIFLSVVLTTALAFVSPAFAQTEKPVAQTNSKPTEEQEAAYSRAIEGRTADILAVLELKDAAKSARAHDVIIAQYRGLRDWHDAHDAKPKDLAKTAAGTDKTQADQAKAAADEIQASLKNLHDQFLAKLATDLTAAQVDQVKDKMTYGKVKATYDGYCDMLPTLTPEQKTKIMDWLKEAREIAMDCGSAGEKTAVFGKYKGRINNYLSKEGYDLKKVSAEWNERLKARSANPAK